MNFPCSRRTYPYASLPSGNTTTVGWPGRRWIILSVVVLCAFTGTIWSLEKSNSPMFSPQKSYQPMNLPSLVYAGDRSSPREKRAVVSTLYSDSYAVGVAVLGRSVRRANVTARLILPYIDGHISDSALCMVRAVGWEPIPVPRIQPPHNGKGIYHRFVDQYTKLNIWALDKMNIEQAIYLDADTLVRRNLDELFDLPFNFAAVPDIYGDKRGFTVNFNAGVLVLRPSSKVLDVMKEKIETADFPLDQAEQSFLNLFFSANALRLPYEYNANLAIKKSSPAMWEGMKEEIRVVHYTLVKPFLNENLPSSKILTEEELRIVMDHAAKKRDNMFAEEVQWWRDAYGQMMEDLEVTKHCDPPVS